MNRKIWKALGIAVCMLALAAPRAMAETHWVGSEKQFKDAVEAINKPGDAKNEIILTQSFTLKGNYNYILTNSKTTTIKTTTIKGEGHTIFVEPNAGITVTGKGNVLNLGAEGYKGTLTIDRDPRDGSVPETRGAFITVSGGATANMYEHVTLQNWQFAGNACVVIMGSKSNSVFNMYGGVIENCSRAVTAASGATFYMQSGKIKDCRFGGNRVISVNGGSKFIMDGGTISGCKADEGGGLYADNSTVTISGGTISECEGRWGGGLYAKNSLTITISGGTISGCTAVLGNGGGLYADHSTITISDGTISGSTISGCTASAGGGLYATNSSEITISGGTISECTATINNGGGLYATNQSTINISDGIISRCKGVLGCGLYATDSSEITISGGTISGCTGLRGGGLYAEKKSTITITGGTISRCEVGAGGGLFVTDSTLNIEGGTISECIASDSGKGGGLYAENSTLTISGGTIKGNKAAYGGGVALVKSKVKVEEPITNWTVVDNEAYKTDTGSGYIGGGIYLESGSMDVSNGSNKIYNNTADGHGADICLTDDTSSIKLPNAANMGAKYLDSGIYIDGWYNDDNPRYTPSESGVPVKVDGAEPLKGALSLVASYKAVPVRTVTIDTNGGVGGSGSQTVQKGTTVTLEAPTKEGHLFKGWKDEKGNSYPAGEDGKVNITVNENMKLTAVWKARTFTVTYVLLNGETRAETVDYGQKVTLGEEPRTGYTFVGWKDGEKMYHAGETITVTGDMTLTAEWKKLPSAENLPKTGDESPVLLWGAALAVSAAACFVLRRKK